MLPEVLAHLTTWVSHTHLPREQVYQFWLGHAIWQDARDGSNTCPEQVNLGFPFTSASKTPKLDFNSHANACFSALRLIQSPILSKCPGQPWSTFTSAVYVSHSRVWQLWWEAHLRDHILRLFVQHLNIGHHHTAPDLLVQMSQNVVNSFPDVEIIHRHT